MKKSLNIRENPYLKRNRLADVLAAIQALALRESFNNSTAEWARLISGNKEHEQRWQEVFDDHPEFFRKSDTREGFYQLVWRRSMASRPGDDMKMASPRVPE